MTNDQTPTGSPVNSYDNHFEPTAADLMTPSALVVSPDTSVDEAIQVLIENRVTGVPVVDEDGRLRGIFTETDRLNLLLTESSPAAIQVRDVMTKGVITVDEDTTLDQINELLLRANIRRVPVMRDGKIVGIVSRSDVVKALRGARMELQIAH
jgi:CBS domain-containing protein